MGRGPSVSAEIEIAASPDAVRSVFLDFQRYKEWTQRFNFSTHNTGKAPADLQPGDVIKVDAKGTVFHPVMVENSAASFQWHGNLYGVFNGTHQFHFTPSQKTAGGTTLLQKEDFGGLLSFMVKPGWSMAQQTQANFEAFNNDLKAEVEKAAK